MSAGDARMEDFRSDVGDSGAVCVRGGGTRWGVGGWPDGAREVSAPSGIVTLEPAEMTVMVGAGTVLSDLVGDLAGHGLEVVASPAQRQPPARGNTGELRHRLREPLDRQRDMSDGVKVVRVYAQLGDQNVWPEGLDQRWDHLPKGPEIDVVRGVRV